MNFSCYFAPMGCEERSACLHVCLYSCHHLENLLKHNVIFDSASLAPLCENMTSYTKPEVHSV